MNVLIGCEESQVECMSFRRLGFNAFSCDLKSCSGGFPEFHIKSDIFDVLPENNKDIRFYTSNGDFYHLDKWDLCIFHPPCTFLTIAGACNIPKDNSRIEKGFVAAEFFNRLLSFSCDFIAVENPIIMKRFPIRKYDDKIYPYMFGDVNNKPICLWLKGLPFLVPTSMFIKDVDYVSRIYKGKRMSVSRWYYNSAGKNHSTIRSKSFTGIADAMAKQWGCYVYEQRKLEF